MKKVVVLLALLVVLAACAGSQPPVTNGTNVSQVDTSTTAQPGDLVSVNFVMTLDNGSVVDTNNESLAEKNHLPNYVKGPFTFVISQSGKIAGFDKQVIGMKVGERKEVVIEPTEKPVVFTLNKTQAMKRSVQLPLKRSFKLASYQELFGKPPVVGDVIANSQFAFRYQVKNITESSVVARAIVTEGQVYQLEGVSWPSRLLSVFKKEDIGTFIHLPEVNRTFESDFGTARVLGINGSLVIVEHDPALNELINKSIKIDGIPISQQFQVVAMTNSTFTIQRYGQLADKRVHLSVELLNLTKGVKKVKEQSAIPAVQTQIEDISTES